MPALPQGGRPIYGRPYYMATPAAALALEFDEASTMETLYAREPVKSPNMARPITIAALPIGEFDNELVKSEFDAILDAFKRLGLDPVLADPISNEAEVSRAVQRLAQNNPDLLLLIALRGLSAPIMEAAGRLSRVPCLLWPIQGRFALPSSALAAGALREAGLPVELFYAPPNHPAASQKIRSVTRAAGAYSRIRQSRIGVVGGLFPNLVSCRYDPQTVSSRLGVTLLPIPFGDVRDAMRAESLRAAEIERARQRLASSHTVQAVETRALDAGLALHLALKRLAQEQGIAGFATECWSGLPRELGLNPCLGFVDDAYTLACEGDVMLCVALLIVRYLTGAGAYVGDVYDLDLDGVLTLTHCGAPASLASHPNRVVLAPSPLAAERGFETVTCRPQLSAGPATIFRFYGQGCDKMHLALGELTSSDSSANSTVRVKLNGSRWDFLDQCLGNHYLVAAGDIRDELKMLCNWLAITIFET